MGLQSSSSASDIQQFNKEYLDNKKENDPLSQTLTRLDDSFARANESLNNSVDLFQKATTSVFDQVAGFWGGDSMRSIIGDFSNYGLSGSGLTNDGKTGLAAYPAPSPEQYATCQDVGGLSVWSTSGWWRCLFPESIIGEKVGYDKIGDVLSREKVEHDSEHKYGLFFTQFDAYLSWKAHMQRMQREKQKKEEEQWRQQRQTQLQEWSANKSDVPERYVVGSSSSTYVNYQDGERVEITKTKLKYDDGTVERKEVKKTYPRDGGEPIVEEKSSEGKAGFWR